MIRATKIFTISFFVIAAISITAYDVWVISTHGVENSISQLIIEWSYRYPLFVFLMGNVLGILEGHLFWRLRDNERTKRLGK